MNRFTPIDRWLNFLQHPDASRRLKAVKRARELGDAQVDFPLRHLAVSDPDTSVRLAALQTVIDIGDDETGWTLQRAVLDPDPGIRKQAVDALAGYPGADSAHALASRVNDSYEIAESACRSLSRIGDEFAVRELDSMTGPGVLSLRLQAIAALGATRNPAAVPKLAHHLHSNEPQIRAAAVEALGNFGHTTEFTGAGAILVDTLVRSLDDPEPEVRLNGAKALRHVKAWETCVPLNAALGDEDARVREAAANTLALLDAPQHPRMATLALRLESRRLRVGAIRRLENLADPTGFAALMASLGDEDAEVRRAAEAAIRTCRLQPDLAHFREALESEVPRLRAGAIRCLTERRDHASVPQFLKALQDSDLAVRVSAAKALGDLDVADACPPLCLLLADPAPELREAVIESLGKLGCRRALPALHERYKTFGGEPDGDLRLLLRAAIHSIKERAEQHAHLPLAASPPELEDEGLLISATAPTASDGR